MRTRGKKKKKTSKDWHWCHHPTESAGMLAVFLEMDAIEEDIKGFR